MYTEREISDKTGYASGDWYTSDEEVRAYLQLSVMRDMWPEWSVSDDRDDDGYPIPLSDEEEQTALDLMADTIIAEHWHCAYGEIGQIEEVAPLPLTIDGVIDLYEDSGGGLHLVSYPYVISMTPVPDGDARADMADLSESRGDGWNGYTVYGQHGYGLDQMQHIARYTRGRTEYRDALGLQRVYPDATLTIAGRPGNAGRAYLGPDAPVEE